MNDTMNKVPEKSETATPRMSRNHQEKNRIYLKRRGDSGSVLEHMWQGKTGLQYPQGKAAR